MFPQRSTYRPNPNATSGLGAYYAPKYETAINGLGATCNCGPRPVSGYGAIVGDDSSYPSPLKIAVACALVGVVVYGVTKIKI